MYLYVLSRIQKDLQEEKIILKQERLQQDRATKHQEVEIVIYALSYYF